MFSIVWVSAISPNLGGILQDFRPAHWLLRMAANSSVFAHRIRSPTWSALGQRSSFFASLEMSSSGNGWPSILTEKRQLSMSLESRRPFIGSGGNDVPFNAVELDFGTAPLGEWRNRRQPLRVNRPVQLHFVSRIARAPFQRSVPLPPIFSWPTAIL